MKKASFIAGLIAIITIAWDLGVEAYPSIIGFIHNAAAPATFGIQTGAEIVTSSALLYLIFGRRPREKDQRELVTSAISVCSFLLLSIVSFLYVLSNWNMRVPYDVRPWEGVTFYELLLSTAGILGNLIGWIAERIILRSQYSATLEGHSHQLALCMLSSVIVGLVAMAPKLGWPDSWLSPETIGGLIIALMAAVEGIHIWRQRGHHHHHS